MRRMTAMLFVALVSMVATVGTAPTAAREAYDTSAHSAPPSSEPSFAGAWRVSITPDGGPMFGGVSTYAADGTIVSSVLPVQPAMPSGSSGVSFASAGHGLWVATEEGSADLVIVHLRADGDGAFIGTMTIRAAITLAADGQTFAGEFVRTVADPAGNTVMTLEGEVAGMRITLGPTDGRAAVATTCA